MPRKKTKDDTANDTKEKRRGTPGRPPRYRTALELDRKCQEYIKLCEEKDVFPDEAGMLEILGISDTTKTRYIANEDDKYRHYGDAFARARRARESWLSRRPFKDPKTAQFAQFAQFALKQDKNGGYVDKTAEREGGVQVTVKLEGVKGSDAFG